MTRADITAEKVRSWYHYDPETGAFTRRIRLHRFRGYAAGGAVGHSTTDGYLQLWVCGVTVRLHRIIWLYMTGEWPKHVIDHKDGDGTNNRWKNIRDVPQLINVQNQRKVRKNNKLGLTGVTAQGLGYRANIRNAQGKKLHLGTFPTPNAAHAVYLAAKRQLHEGNTL